MLPICQTRKNTEDLISSLSNDYFDTPKSLWRWFNLHKGNQSPMPPLSHSNRNVIEHVS